jgi:hypothetical protein
VSVASDGAISEDHSESQIDSDIDSTDGEDSEEQVSMTKKKGRLVLK